MLMNRLDIFLRKEKILDPSQGAFQSQKSAIDQVAFLSQKVQDGFNEKKTSLGVFVDFKAAYDLVSRPKLISKLESMKTSNEITVAVRDFLCQRFISVRHHDRTSSFKQTKKGLLGAVFSPILFKIFMNDLIQKLKKIPGVVVIFYADDLTILVQDESSENLEKIMNEALKVLQDWVDENEAVVNVDKTKFQIFSLSNEKFCPLLELNDCQIEETEDQTYLGICLDRR